MKWIKKGLICNSETLGLEWYKKNIMVPVPVLLENGVLRIFNTMCDENHVGRIGYVDVNPENPSEVLGYSKEPVFDIGRDGAFDDNGVVVSCIREHEGQLLMYYSGYQLCTKTPYLIFASIATAEDGFSKFKRLTDNPQLDRTHSEICVRSAPYVLPKKGGGYLMWYNADCDGSWTVNEEGKKLPVYVTKCLSSDDPSVWTETEGDQCFKFEDSDEYALSTPTLWFENDLYKMIYSVRTFSKGYRLGYAESLNGVDFTRKDHKMDIDVSKDGWDSEMMCFGHRYQYKDKVYLFYVGNNYGCGGMGYAELDQGANL